MEVMTMVSTVTVRGQISIPAEIRKRHHITAHTKMAWLDDGHTISLLPVPEDPVKALRGRFKDGDLLAALLKERKEDRDRE